MCYHYLALFAISLLVCYISRYLFSVVSNLHFVLSVIPPLFHPLFYLYIISLYLSGISLYRSNYICLPCVCCPHICLLPSQLFTQQTSVAAISQPVSHITTYLSSLDTSTIAPYALLLFDTYLLYPHVSVMSLPLSANSPYLLSSVCHPTIWVPSLRLSTPKFPNLLTLNSPPHIPPTPRRNPTPN